MVFPGYKFDGQLFLPSLVHIFKIISVAPAEQMYQLVSPLPDL